MVTQSQLVPSLRHNSAVPIFLRHGFARVRLQYRCLCLLFLVVLLAGAAAAADVPNAHASLPGLTFSVADFDGDSKPDLASVQAGKSDLTSTDYRIQLQLSTSGRQIFQIIAPAGGLQIASRDVNGDHALDLVLTTWLGQPVAVLLNDGHGNFSRAEPSAFQEAFSGSQAGWRSSAELSLEIAGLPSQSREDICSQTRTSLRFRPQARLVVHSDLRFGIDPFLISHFGRAPPFEVSYS